MNIKTAFLINNLAYCHFKIGKYSSALSGYYKTFSLFKNAKADKHPNFFAAIDFFDEELTSFLDKMKKENIPQLKMAIRLIEKIFNDR